MQKTNSTSEDDVYVQELFLHVSEHLRNQVQSLSIEVSDKGITIDGVCGSFHSKQLAQEL